MGPKERPSESYLVRIYRRDRREPHRIAGLVELIEQERTETFKSSEELMRILGVGSGSTSGSSAGNEQ